MNQKMKLHTFNVPVTWEMSGTYEVRAETAERAAELALTIQGLPKVGHYVEDSMRVEDGWIEDTES